MTSLATYNKPNHVKTERQPHIPASNHSNKKPPSSKYLHLKTKLSTMKPTRGLTNQSATPAAKVHIPSRKSQKNAPEMVKNVMKKSEDIQRNHDKASMEMTNTKEIKSPQQDVILEFESKLKTTNHNKLSKISAQSYPEHYNPKQFSSNKVDEVKKPVENKKMSVEEIQKNLKKWRIQREMKVNVNNPKDYCSGDNKTNFIYKEVPKFIPERKKYVDVATNMHENNLATNMKSNKAKLIDAWTNSSDIKCVFLSADSSESTETKQTNLEQEPLTMSANKTMHHISIQVNLNEDLNPEFEHDGTPCKQNDICETLEKNKISSANDKDNAMLLREHGSDYHKVLKEIEIAHDRKLDPKSDLLSKRQELTLESDGGTKTKGRPITSNSEKVEKTKNAISNSELFTACTTHLDTLPEDSTIEKHKKSIYILVDRYLNKTKNNPSQSMDNFMKYMLQNIESSKANPVEAMEQFNQSYFLQQRTINTPELSIKEIKDREVMTQSGKRKETESFTSTPKCKEKYDKNINTQKFKSKLLLLDKNHIIADEENRKPSLKIVNDEVCLQKKEKFKTLTLINPKQNEKMCIHINYQPHNNLISKSKLTIHKESHINIRPQLTKHTFTTATCYPQQFSSRPNISTRYLVHLDEGGCKEIKPKQEEEIKNNIYEHSGTMAHKKSRLDHIIRCLIRYVKLNLRLSNRMTSAVCEKLLSAQEFLCCYYSNQHGNFNSLSPNSRQIITMILLEVDNPNGLNIDVKTNNDMKLIIQLIIENLQNLHSSKNVSGPPPPPPPLHVNNENNPMRRPENSNLYHSPSSKPGGYYLHSRRKFRKSFGMKKNYLNKKIRSTLDREPLNYNENNANTSVPNKCDCPVNVLTKLSETSETDHPEEIKVQSSDASEIKQNSEDVVYESDWATPSSSSDEESLKSVLPETSNLAEIKIRLQDLGSGSHKEHYRISVNTNEASMQPQLPCVILNPDVSPIEQSAKGSKVNIAYQDTISNNTHNAMHSTVNILPSTLCDHVKNPKAAMKSRTNFTNNDKSYVDSAFLAVSKPEFNETQFSHPSVLNKNDILAKENSCGDNNLITNVWPVEVERIFNMKSNSNHKDVATVDKVNIGVNTDASLLDNLLRKWHSDTGDSYACDLSLCFSTTDNELSEGEIGLYASYRRDNYHCGECKFPNETVTSTRQTRRRNIQRTADVFLSRTVFQT